jgi:O-antigen ligase
VGVVSRPGAGPDGPALALALGAAAAAVLSPPEVSLLGRSVLAALASGAALWFAWRPPLTAPGTGWSSACLLPLLAASLLAAPCRSRALDETALFATLVLVGLLGFAAARDERSWTLVPVLLSALGCGVALQAILQAAWLYPRQAALLRTDVTPVVDNLILRLESGRPAGPFILPSSLGGFLALALPGTLLLALRPASRLGRAFWLAIAVLEIQALVLTRSLGALGATACGLLLLLPALSPRRRIAAGAVVAFAAIALGGWFLEQRRAEFDRGPLGDPLRLRTGNWSAAAQMIGDRPLLGVGPGSFGTAYTRYLQEGMNETRYAHNSYLQAAAGWGVWIGGPIVVLVFGFLRAIGARREAGRDPAGGLTPRLAVAAGAATFLLHNLVDFTLYLPGVAVPAAVLLGMSLGSGRSSLQRESGRHPGACVAAVAAAVFLGWNALSGVRSEAHMVSAREAAGSGRLEKAAYMARQAARARPGSPEPWAFLAQLVLAHRMDADEARREGAKAASRAVRLDPDSAILHHTVALYHAAAGEPAPAFVEERRAHQLYPLKREYQPPAGGSP